MAIDATRMAFCAGPALPSRLTARPRIEVRTRSPARVRAAASGDLLVVGAGALGVRAARLWREAQPDSKITCATWTTERHELIEDEGFTPAVSSELSGEYTNVLFCAPPSKAEAKYPDTVAAAAALAKDNFVFTSSTAVYKDVPEVTEQSELNDTPRVERLLNSEEAARKAGGRVVRLGGLYDAVRGPHAVWCRNGKCAGCREGILNMLHYDDAAAAAIAALNVESEDDTFVAVDGNPITRLEIVEAALKHFRFDHLPMPPFGDVMKSVKVINCEWSMEKLGWKPKWTSFKEFMQLDHDAIMNDAPAPGMPLPQCELVKGVSKNNPEMEHPAIKYIFANLPK